MDLIHEKDPGRRELAVEFLREGRTLFELPLAGGGTLEVTAHPSCEAKPPRGAPPGTRQEWRVLRFIPAEGTSDLVQSVTKVCVGPDGHEPREWLRWDALPLDYTKSQVTVALSALAALGRPVLPGAASAQKEPLRILCIGLGGGSVPSFLSQRFADCEVDVVELEESVVEAAYAGMGFVPHPRVRVSVGDGAEFALHAAHAAGNAGGATVYDAVLVDAYDAAGNVPMVLQNRTGGLAQALATGLLRRSGGLVATNFLPSVDLAPPLAAYRSALVDRGAGLAFSVQARGTGNRIAVQTCGGPEFRSMDEMTAQMQVAAIQIEKAIGCPFGMAELATRNMYEWSAADRA